MIDRAIENWLTKTNERTYQIPFCQVLMSQGHKVVYISPHSQMEQGKDIITIGPDKKYHAYQLKTGKLDLGEWRLIKSEVLECVELDIVHPSIPEGSPHVSYVVTNGEIKDTVRVQITQINTQNKRKGLGRLETITGQQLLAMFREAQGHFLPTEVADFDLFLKLYLADGTDFLKVTQFFDLIDSCFFHTIPSRKSSRVDAIRSSIVLTGYGLRAYQQAENHYAQFQAWSCLAGAIVRFADRAKLDARDFKDSLDCVRTEIVRCLERLRAEACSKVDFLEGDFMGDGGDVYRARTTLVLGAMALCEMLKLRSSKEYAVNDAVKNVVVNNLRYLWYWGDSALPSFFSIMKFIELFDKNLSQKIYEELVDVITQQAPHGAEGIPSPYYSSLQILEFNMGGAEDELEWIDFAGESYSLETLVLFGVQREYRAFLEKKWPMISEIMFSKFTPQHEHDFFTAHAEEGTNDSRWPPEQESWKRLKAQAATVQVPALVEGTPDVAFSFLFAVPYRGNSDVYCFLDQQCLQTNGSGEPENLVSTREEEPKNRQKAKEKLGKRAKT